MVILIPILFLLALVMLFIGKPLAMKIGLISSLLATLLLVQFSCYLYKDSVGYRQEVSSFRYNLQKDNFDSIYEKFDNRLKGIYTSTVFSDLISTIKEQSDCIHTKHTLISSSENFNMIIWDCKHQKELAIVSFGGGDLIRWEITNINVMSEK